MSGLSDRTVLLALGWGLLVLLSFAGLGRIVAGIVAPGSRRDLALEAGWGMAGMIALGGWFNLLGLATAQVLRGLVLLAIVLGLGWDILHRLRGSSEASTDQDAFPSPPPGHRKFYWISLLVLFLAMKYVSSLNYLFNLNDDQPSYLFQVARLLQNGSIGPDPFSYRQLLSLNGQTFLLGLLGAGAPLQFSYLLDPGVCWLMLGGLTWSLLRRDLGVSPREACLWTRSGVDGPS